MYVEATLKKLRMRISSTCIVCGVLAGLYGCANVGTGWGFHVSAEEVMNGLHSLVDVGKVLYLVCWFLHSTMLRHYSRRCYQGISVRVALR